MTTLTDHYTRTAEGFARRLSLVTPERWHDPTPCTDWDVRKLAAHVLDEQLWIPPLLQGRTIAEVGDRFSGDQLGTDAASAWSAATRTVHELLAAPDVGARTVHLSYGDETADNYLRQVAADTLIHTWDLARAIGTDEELGAEDVDTVAAFLAPQAEAWRAGGAFAGAVPAPPGADAQTRLLALTGRTA